MWISSLGVFCWTPLAYGCRPWPVNDEYSGLLDYDHAPWFDWGPYLWANGERRRTDFLNWCSGQDDLLCAGRRDVRFGDLRDQYKNQFWGDLTHPTADGAEKVADQLVKFITGDLPAPQTNISNWVLPWKDY